MTNLAKFREFGIDPTKIRDGITREEMETLLNVTEDLYEETQTLKEKVQCLENEINRLKGEQGQPKFHAKRDISSTNDRPKSQDEQRKKTGKQEGQTKKIKRRVNCEVDKATLPADAVFKGYETQVIPEIILRVDYIEFKREKYYSPSLKKTYTAPLPKAYQGSFSSSVRELVILLKHELKTTEANIVRFLTNIDCRISNATISRMLTKKLAPFHEEKEEIAKAGIECGTYLQTDDTQAKVKGESHHTHILCNALFSAYFTEPNKDRLTVLDIMRLKKPRQYCINTETVWILEQMKVPKKRLRKLRIYAREEVYNESDFKLVLGRVFPNPNKLVAYQKRVEEAAYISAYHQEDDCVRTLICDDAPQFKLLTASLGLCWIHEGRHYKKLRPAIPYHQAQLSQFLKLFWGYYGRLLMFKTSPSKELARELEKDFDALCSTKFTYAALKDRLAKTLANKQQLLTVLSQPDIPLHNNTSELAARAKVRDRDIHLHTMSDEGTKATDTFMTILESARKLNVNTHQYIKDRVSGAFALPSLAHIIRSRSPLFSGP